MPKLLCHLKVDQYYHWYNHTHRHSGICYITPQQCYEGKGPDIMKKRNDVIDIYYQMHKNQGLLRENITSTGKKRRSLWQTPEKVEVMPFYTKLALLPTHMHGEPIFYFFRQVFSPTFIP